MVSRVGDQGGAEPADGSGSCLPNLDLIIRGLLYVYIFSLPFKQLLFIERNGFIILIVLVVLWCAINRRHFFTRTPIDLPLLCFVAWVGLTVPFATFPEYSAKEFAKLVQQGLIFYLVAYFFKDVHDRVRVSMVLMIALFVVSASTYPQFFSMLGREPSIEGNIVVDAFLPGEVWLTTYLIMLIPLSLSLALYTGERSSRIFYACIAAMAIVSLVFTFSRAGYLALIVELWVVAWLLRRKVFWRIAAFASLIILGGMTVIVVYDATYKGNIRVLPGTSIPLKFTASAVKHRMEIWQFAAESVREHPLVGIGFGKDNFRLVHAGSAKSLQDKHVLEAGTHNTFLDIALGTGIPGLVFFLWLMLRIGSRALRLFRRHEEGFCKAISMGAGVCVLGLSVRVFFDHMFIGTLAIMFWVLVSLALAAKSPNVSSVRASSVFARQGELS